MLASSRSLVVPWQESILSLQTHRHLLGHRVTCAVAGLSLKARALVRISSTSCFSGLVARRLRGQQRKGTVSSAFHRVTIVGAVTGADERTNLNQKPLYDELQRYGLDESDYDFTAFDTNQVGSSGDSSGEVKLKSRASKRNANEVIHRPTLREESGVSEDWCAYLLLSADTRKTYVGVTYDIRRRLRQHNGELAGGAKAARAGRPWRLVATVKGFNTRSEACQFEWRWKSTAAKVKTISELDLAVNEVPLVTRRRATLAEVLKTKDEWRSLIVEWHAP